MNKEYILKSLEIFKPIEIEQNILLKLPVIIESSDCLLQLIIKPDLEGYLVETYYVANEITGNVFSECNDNKDQYYYNLFIKNDNHEHYDIKYQNNKYFKKYQKNYNITWALHEFIYFFINLDHFYLEITSNS